MADALSRLSSLEAVELLVKPNDELLSKVAESYQEDEFFSPILKALEKGRTNQIYSLVKKGDLQLIYTDDRLCIPDNKYFNTTLLTLAHDKAGHFGLDKTYNGLKKEVFWPKMKQSVDKYVQTCEVCQRNRASNQRPAGLLQPLPIPEGIWTDITTDLTTDLPLTT